MARSCAAFASWLDRACRSGLPTTCTRTCLNKWWSKQPSPPCTTPTPLSSRALAALSWDGLADLHGGAPCPQAARRRPGAGVNGPVVLMDVGNNVGGWSRVGSAIRLAEARRLGGRSLVQTLCDPEAVRACV